MPRRPRIAPGGLVYHVLNRGVARLALFEKDADYEAFERVLVEALAEHSTRLLSYCVMPNHWHMVLWPRREGELTEFLRWLTHTHVMRWHAHFKTSGTGHLYQGRFKSFPVETDEHFYTVVRYVERNALRANLVERAEDWRWSSLWRREFGSVEAKSLLARWPLPMSADWTAHVNRPQTPAEVDAVRNSIRRGCPFGSAGWQTRTARRLGLDWTLRARGRPRKQPEPEQ
ncbi:MAG: transposase [Polaromonas sp.]|uniref:transposase n=1 Tax=Polaromonas sp. TaxID=1869339 RepID=UPI0025EED541|nr:transposase [Polaromonas sp.]MBI2725810.1 transposase [Polaromonas sp.]